MEMNISDQAIDAIASLLNYTVKVKKEIYERIKPALPMVYMIIFLSVAKENNAQAIPYDFFAEKLLSKLVKNSSQYLYYDERLNNFIRVWNDFCNSCDDLYQTSLLH